MAYTAGVGSPPHLVPEPIGGCLVSLCSHVGVTRAPQPRPPIRCRKASLARWHASTLRKGADANPWRTVAQMQMAFSRGSRQPSPKSIIRYLSIDYAVANEAGPSTTRRLNRLSNRHSGCAGAGKLSSFLLQFRNAPFFRFAKRAREPIAPKNRCRIKTEGG